jgi:hypothetical protein
MLAILTVSCTNYLVLTYSWHSTRRPSLKQQQLWKA